MNRFLLRVFPTALAAGLLAATLPALAQPARGLIVRLKPVDASTVRETPQAAGERLRAIARDAGLALQAPRALGPDHQVVGFGRLLQGQALDDAVRRMRLNPEVASVEPDVLLRRLAVPNDPDFSNGRQWHLQAPVAPNVSAINLPPAWDRTTGSASAGNVAVLDTGIRPHPDLAGRYVGGYDFVTNEIINGVSSSGDGDGRDADPTDPGDWVTPAEASALGCDAGPASWHGTFIAGQIAAATNNGVGVAGVNWQNKVVPVRVSGKCGAFVSDVFDGMLWAAGLPVSGAPANPNPARIINLSFGGSSTCTDAYQSVINQVTAVGALLVVAGGNESGPVTRPADCRGVLAVGAVRQDGLKAWYSNYGPAIGLAAPGGSAESTSPELWSTLNDGTYAVGNDTYGYKSGTSFSAPLAAGVASLMLAINPALTPSELVGRLRLATRPHAYNPAIAMCSNTNLSQGVCNCTTDTCGTGLLDANAAVQLAYGPAVVIAPLADVAAGATVALDGSRSAAIPGSTIVSYAWRQVAGPATATLQNAASAVASATLPVAGSYVFTLRVTDSAALAAEESVTVNALTPVSTGGGGGGSTGWWWGAGLWALAALAWRRRNPG